MVSRIARVPISIPAGVDVKVNKQNVVIKGAKGTLTRDVHDLVSVEYSNDNIVCAPIGVTIHANALSGTMRALLQNMVTGVTTGFDKKLTMIGVGYRAKAQGQKLDLTVGFSHPVVLEMPDGVTVATPSPTEIILSGSDKQKVNQMAAVIRKIRPPEPYKGKGIRYHDEHVVRKEGKKK